MHGLPRCSHRGSPMSRIRHPNARLALVHGLTDRRHRSHAASCRRCSQQVRQQRAVGALVHGLAHRRHRRQSVRQLRHVGAQLARAAARQRAARRCRHVASGGVSWGQVQGVRAGQQRQAQRRRDAAGQRRECVAGAGQDALQRPLRAPRKAAFDENPSFASFCDHIILRPHALHGPLRSLKPGSKQCVIKQSR